MIWQRNSLYVLPISARLVWFSGKGNVSKQSDGVYRNRVSSDPEYSLAQTSWIYDSRTAKTSKPCCAKMTSRAFRKFVTSYFGICSTAQVAVGRAYLYRMAKLTYHGLTKRCTRLAS